ncbi:uncharacterized protein BX664DRAFT_329404 [Halteromyces radiatus]|uniref:uncharacterized protein n=1 Tax=Halteromyces radiatus TaxID=101107 RepID=UPI0022203434|nr:uncharacterized protein BX664DRAFT_329404 [Halteromyces radiatus]KAI8093300.1 hypothetical protein BX664DRAFT_329404 [Halteromyces radiatus]
MNHKKRSSVSKLRFIDLAQAALEEADLEDERKGVLEEVVEALISTTGAPMLSEVINAQLASQDVIERTAEQHFLHNTERTNNNNNNDLGPIDFKEHDDPATLLPPSPPPEPSFLSSSTSSPSTLSPSSSSSSIVSSISYWQSTYVIGNYLWRMFRILILASLVALFYQFYLHHHQQYFYFILWN